LGTTAAYISCLTIAANIQRVVAISIANKYNHFVLLY
jgi:hypothetical protein